MSTPVTLGQPPEVEYPDSDGQPMSDNTLQFQWIVTLQGNLDAIFRHDPNVFVAGDLLWYPVQGRNDVGAAPDALVAFGRPKGYRGSYRQWEEGGVAPQVVFEVLSPSNRPAAMDQKFQFYDSYGVEEYYVYDPDQVVLTGWRRVGGRLQPIAVLHNWVSPRLQIRFDLSGPELVIYDPAGEPFRPFVQVYEQWQAARQQAEQERQRAEQERQRAEQERQRAEEERQRAQEEQQRREQAEQRAREEQSQREQAEQRARLEQQRRQQAEQQAREERQQREQAEQRTRDEQQQREKAEQRAALAEQQTRLLMERLRAAGIDPDAPPEAPPQA